MTEWSLKMKQDRMVSKQGVDSYFATLCITHLVTGFQDVFTNGCVTRTLESGVTVSSCTIVNPTSAKRNPEIKGCPVEPVNPVNVAAKGIKNLLTTTNLMKK